MRASCASIIPSSHPPPSPEILFALSVGTRRLSCSGAAARGPLFYRGSAAVVKILIVDDDPDMVAASRIVLERDGYSVVSASNMQDGLRDFAEAKPDLLILDVMMEEQDDGLRFARQVRRMGSTLPILMLTSVNRAMGLQIGRDDEMVPVDEFVEKPVDPATLSAKVKALLAAKGAAS
jgi:DNA-binding response OmpR family regulator